MNKLVSFFVKRYLRFDREQPFISLSAILAFIGIALGVMVLIIAMAIMNGFDKELEKRLSIMNYPLTILATNSKYIDEVTLKKLEQNFPEIKFSPYLVASIITKVGKTMKGGFLFGVDFNREIKLNPVIKEAIQDKNISKFQVIIGDDFQKNMFVSLNSKITYIFTDISPTGLNSTPKIKRFKVVGTFSSGLNGYDEAYHFSTLTALQKIAHIEKNYFHGIHATSSEPTKDIQRLNEFLKNLDTKLKFRIVGWWEQNKSLFSALEMEKRALFIVLMLIILIASVNIISSLLMTVMNRRSEIALLLSLGATREDIKKIFLYLGIVIGFTGILTGVILSFIGLYILSNFDIISLPADIYGTSSLPLELSLSDFLSIVIGAFIIVLMSAIYPALKAKKINITETLKNEY